MVADPEIIFSITVRSDVNYFVISESAVRTKEAQTTTVSLLGVSDGIEKN
jgi:hypothetical protein